jgi:hypothetical protein
MFIEANLIPTVNENNETIYYVVDDEPIRSDDKILHKNKVYTVSKNRGLYLSTIELTNIDLRTDTCKKILASTDKELDLPKIPVSFIKELDKIKELHNVSLQCFLDYSKIPNDEDMDLPWGAYVEYKLQVNESNEVIIKPSKNSWNRNEILDILTEFETLCSLYQSNKDWFPQKKAEFLKKYL